MATMIPMVMSAFSSGSMVSTIISAVGTLAALQGAKTDTANAEAAARGNQAQLNYQAGQEEAAAQLKATQDRRRADLMISRGIAVAAASGGGTAGVDRLLQGIAGEGETQASYDMYQGTERAKQLRYQGQVGVEQAKAMGRATMMNAYMDAANSASGPISSLYSRFAPGSPPTDVGTGSAGGFDLYK